jgi:carbon storage regulator
MLVLSRKNRESIVIGDDIVVTIVEIGRGRVQIGVRAPSEIPVYRQEIVERMVANGERNSVGFDAEEIVLTAG